MSSIIQLRIHSLNGCAGQGCARLELGTKKLYVGFPCTWVAGTQGCGPSSATSQMHQQEAGLEAEQLHLNWPPCGRLNPLHHSGPILTQRCIDEQHHGESQSFQNQREIELRCTSGDHGVSNGHSVLLGALHPSPLWSESFQEDGCWRVLGMSPHLFERSSG